MAYRMSPKVHKSPISTSANSYVSEGVDFVFFEHCTQWCRGVDIFKIIQTKPLLSFKKYRASEFTSLLTESNVGLPNYKTEGIGK